MSPDSKLDRERAFFGPYHAEAFREKEDVGPEHRVRAWLELRHAAHGRGEKELTFVRPDPDARLATLRAWRAMRRMITPAAPAAPPATNWIPIGPAVVRRGQATGAPPVSGRAVDIAIAQGGSRVYVASANGGVWRSDNGGDTWRPLMDSLALAPTYVDADSLACGAIAINPANADRIYVGTGEGESATFFNGVFGVVYSYAGVGPLRNDFGGDGPWVTEPVTAGSPSLNGQAFYQLAVDPNDAERVVGATTVGIYRREPDGAGGYRWTQTHAGYATSVVAASDSGVTTWYAAMLGGPALTSSDGATWVTVGTSFPTGVSRVTLAIQPTNSQIVYAFSSAGVHRLDISNGSWVILAASPAVDGANYGAAIAVDPTNVDTIFLGAYSVGASGDAKLFRGAVSATPSLSTTDIGARVHPDVHRVVVRSDAPDELWVACDGGVFRTTTARGAATFTPRNVGLATVTCTYLDHHPTEAAVVFCGVQDNGAVRYTGEEAWLHSDDGDGGPMIVNWADPYRVLRSYVYGTLYRTSDGGAGPGSWSNASPAANGALFYPPLACAPPSGTAADADIVAMGADRTWFSSNFGGAWSSPDTAALAGTVSAVEFASATRMYAGTTNGRVYVYTRAGAVWSAATLVGQVGGGTTGLAPIITDVVVDSADATGASFFVSLGGSGDWRRIWHYDGTTWTNRSGPSAGDPASLLAVHFSALVADRANPSHLFAGADIGVWRSTDGGANWSPYAEGLPEAGVTDLKLHPTRRLLRAATYGRGVYEREIDAASALGVELYARDTTLDVGRWSTVDWLADPESTAAPHPGVRHWESPNIKVDPPASNGTYQTGTSINFFDFVDTLVDGSDGVATVDSSTGTAINRVYVEVHNRGVLTADGVLVTLLITNASASLSATPLPMGYASNAQNGIPINTSTWKTVGIKTINGLRVGLPQVVEFDLPSTLLPAPSSLPGQSHYCLLALLHHTSDQFTNAEPNADALAIAERKVAQRNLQIVAFTGTLPPAVPQPTKNAIKPVPALLNIFSPERRADLVVDSGGFRGLVSLVLPAGVDPGKVDSVIGGERLRMGALDEIVREHLAASAYAIANSRASASLTRPSLQDLEALVGGTAIRFSLTEKRTRAGIRGLALPRPIRPLLVFEAPDDAVVGDSWEIAVFTAQGRTIAGGSTYRCQVMLAPDDQKHVKIETGIVRDGTRGHTLVLAKPSLRHAKSRLEKDGAPSAWLVGFGPRGVEKPVRMTWDRDRGAFAADVGDAESHRGVRRVTVVARIGEHEGRKTISLW